jgi:hypothetical protein
MKKTLILAGLFSMLLASGAWAIFGSGRTAVSYFDGHTHDGSKTDGAPAHSGGLDRQGCHNGSVPYHCH